jgi:hypothetical protein
MRERLTCLVKQSFLTKKELEEFLLMEEKMVAGAKEKDWLRSFHLSNDDYLRLLKKVLKGLVKIKEPKADLKLQSFIEEYGSMLPAVFMTPWEMTLTDLDKAFGF